MKNEQGYTLVELFIVLFAFAIIPLIIGGATWWTGRSLDWALTQWKHHAVHVPYWLDFLVAMVGNGFALAFNVIVEILRSVA